MPYRVASRSMNVTKRGRRFSLTALTSLGALLKHRLRASPPLATPHQPSSPPPHVPATLQHHEPTYRQAGGAGCRLSQQGKPKPGLQGLRLLSDCAMCDLWPSQQAPALWVQLPLHWTRQRQGTLVAQPLFKAVGVARRQRVRHGTPHLAVRKVPIGSEGATSSRKQRTPAPPENPVCAQTAAHKHRHNLANTDRKSRKTIIMPAGVSAPIQSNTHKHARLN